MKIKLSKSQWEGIGKKAGWIGIESKAESKDICKRCKKSFIGDGKSMFCPKCLKEMAKHEDNNAKFWPLQ